MRAGRAARPRIGLTGGLAAGKSTVAAWLREAGIRVIDADRLVADLYQPGGAGAIAVARLFGNEFLDAQGGVDHARLAELVFTDAASLVRLQEAIHPLVKQEFEAIARGHSGPVALEAPLLVEAGFAPDFDLVVTVEADEETRLHRASRRGLEPRQGRKRMAAQTDRQSRVAAAHRVLENDGTLEELREQVDDLLREIEEMIEDDR